MEDKRKLLKREPSASEATSEFYLSLPQAQGAALTIRARTDQGLVREQNEDSYVINELLGFAVIADGMGGQAAGEVASKIAAEISAAGLEALGFELRSTETPSPDWIEDRFREVFLQANQTLLEVAEEKKDFEGMGTTLDAVIVSGTKAHIAHIGDGRVYHVRNGVAKLVTQDHSLAAQAVENGILSFEEAQSFSNVLLRSLGTSEELVIDMVQQEFKPGDFLILCTDGVWSHFPTEEEIGLMSQQYQLDAANELVKKSLERGGQDNATAIVIKR